MKRFLRRLPALLIIGLLLPVSSACGSGDKSASAQRSVAVLTVMTGTVTLASPDEAPQQITSDSEAVIEVSQGDRVTTAEASEAVLTYFEGVEVWLAPSTSLDVTTLQVSDASLQVSMNMIAGQTISTVERALDASDSFAIDTQAASISVRGTVFVVFVRDAGLTQVASMEGEVAVAAQGQEVTVPAGYGVRVEPGSPPGEVNVWGEATIDVSYVPDLELGALPVTLTNTENGQTYAYHTGETMMALKGTYTGIVYSPGPYRVPEFTLPEEAGPGEAVEIGVALGAMQVDVKDSEGDDALLPQHFVVTLHQDDLEAQLTVESGKPFAVGPGEWQVTLALEESPDQTTTQSATVEPGAVTHVDWSAGEGG